jgi:hypothetical protein
MIFYGEQLPFQILIAKIVSNWICIPYPALKYEQTHRMKAISMESLHSAQPGLYPNQDHHWMLRDMESLSIIKA